MYIYETNLRIIYYISTLECVCTHIKQALEDSGRRGEQRRPARYWGTHSKTWCYTSGFLFAPRPQAYCVEENSNQEHTQAQIFQAPNKVCKAPPRLAEAPQKDRKLFDSNSSPPAKQHKKLWPCLH